ncbi:alpha/beta fold hydrolase [Cryptosporangium aurantiacum]|uniref:TAP-like protein n=1 Tax=Cryptosporangium aurantiacum TaxID=134849 RepID=A0A1M7RLJ5_9ACTN|nr:alpha/beta hydrolase [Cryptosporangium aurantiacum]SHN47177.1 hypothetical protein SAMN05443668_12125 [Cryptosporangium aurantiacum]
MCGFRQARGLVLNRRGRAPSGPLGSEYSVETEVLEWAAIEAPVDLIIGEDSRGGEPYGTAFDAVAQMTPGATVHVLPGQGHLAHVNAPEALGRLVADCVSPTAVQDSPG